MATTPDTRHPNNPAQYYEGLDQPGTYNVRREEVLPVALGMALFFCVLTTATPATSRPHHMVDNMGGALGVLPDESIRQRMIRYIAAF